MDRPETLYAKSDDQFIAYQTVGNGPVDLVLVDQWFSHMDGLWDVPPLARFVERLSTFSRVITFDERGVGLSDPVPLRSLPSIEEWMDDVRTVMDTVNADHPALVAGLAAGQMATVFAATYPDKVNALVLVDTFPKFVRSADYAAGASPEERAARLSEIRDGWGRGLMLKQFAPSMADDATLLAAWSQYERQAASPGSALAMVEMLYESDVRAILGSIRIPTLVIARGQSTRMPALHSRYVAEQIPGARYVELPGVDTIMWAGDQDAVVAEIQEFLTGARPVVDPDRVLATVLFTDIVGSTERASTMGDRAWRDLLDAHHRIVRAELARHRGREVDTAGDGFLAVFDGPGRAVRCARAIAHAVGTVGLEIRAGVHTGEVEVSGNDLRGIAVHIGARVAALAGPSEVLVSSTVKDLVAGSGIEFDDRGKHALKGVADPWQVFLVTGV